VVVLAGDAIDKLVAAGHLVAAGRVDLARSEVAIAVRAGAARPRIDSETALRAAIEGASRIGYSTGPSGTQLLRLFERWGIAGAVAPRLMQAPPGVPVGSLVARGEVALGFQQLSELMSLPGIDVIGTLPAPVAIVTVFAAAQGSLSARAEPVAALLDFFTSADAADIKRANGMAPA